MNGWRRRESFGVWMAALEGIRRGTRSISGSKRGGFLSAEMAVLGAEVF